MRAEQDISMPIHSAEIASREFPRARKHGIDRDAVKAWLRHVARSYAELELEVQRLRAERDGLTTTIQSVRDRPMSASLRSMMLSANLKKGFGYARDGVDELLSGLSEELSRLETRSAILESERATRETASEALNDRIEILEIQLAELFHERKQIDG